MFSKDAIDAPQEWSDNAVAITALLYMDSKQDKNSVYRLVRRLQKSFLSDGIRFNYWTKTEGQARTSAVSNMLLQQRFAFSSPIWMNYGRLPRSPLASCYIYPIVDSLESVVEAIKTGVGIFSSGGGCGYNISPIRSSREFISSGSRAPGPVEFMSVIGAVSRVIRSGGRDRNSSVVFVIDDDHPDVIEFCRAKSSGKTLLPPNCILTIRLSNRFLLRVEKKDYAQRWPLSPRTSRFVGNDVTVGQLWETIVDEIVNTGEPGIQFVDNINRMHTCPASGAINASNPCGEFLFLDETAAVLASISLSKFIEGNARFAVNEFRATIDSIVVMLNIAIDSSLYPSALIERRTKAFRPILVGFSDLAGALFRLRLAYSDKRSYATCAAISALLTGQAYLSSSRLAQKGGPFPAWRINREPMLAIIRRQLRAVQKLRATTELVRSIRAGAISAFTEALAIGEQYGFKNAQVTAIAPTGTTSIVMDCDANGIEPRLAFRARRYLQNGGVIGIGPAGSESVSAIVSVLKDAGYSADTVATVVQRIENGESVAEFLRQDELGLFECALKSPTGRIVTPKAHVAMTAAAAPFISGGISKTVLISRGGQLSRDEVRALVLDSWRQGIKGITIYRAGTNVDEPIR